MTSRPASLEQQRQVLAAALEVLTEMGSALHQAGGADLGQLLSEVDALAAVAGGVRCELVLEATRRGEIVEAGKNTREWVIDYAPSLRQAGAGCAAPGAWSRVHHVQHWADGGRTDLDNAALLCQRHHTHVHNKRLWAQVRDRPDNSGRYVLWDLTPGSYDQELARVNGTSPWAAA